MCLPDISEVYLEPSRTSSMKLFAKIVNGLILEAKLEAIPNIFEALQNDVEKSQLLFHLSYQSSGLGFKTSR